MSGSPEWKTCAGVPAASAIVDRRHLHLARAPAALGRLEHVGRRFGRLDRIVRLLGGGRRRVGVRLGRRHAHRLFLRQLLLFGLLDVDDVAGDDELRIALAVRLALVEPQGLIAELLDQVERVRHEQDRLVAAAELGELVEALAR